MESSEIMENMDVLECIKKRRSVKKYMDAIVEWDKVVAVLNAGRWAPSSGNLQNWRFIVVKDENKRKDIAEACLQQYWMQDAPVHIVVCSVEDEVERFYGVRGTRLYSVQNCAAAVENMLIAATCLGLGSCWVGAFEEQMIVDILSIPPNARPQAVVTLGYADEDLVEPAKTSLYESVFLERYGNKIKNIDIILKDYGKAMKKQLDKSKEFLTKKGMKALQSIRGKVEETLRRKIENKKLQKLEELNRKLDKTLENENSDENE